MSPVVGWHDVAGGTKEHVPLETTASRYGLVACASNMVFEVMIVPRHRPSFKARKRRPTKLKAVKGGLPSSADPVSLARSPSRASMASTTSAAGSEWSDTASEASGASAASPTRVASEESERDRLERLLNF